MAYRKFDRQALHVALDEQRRLRDMSWAAVGREINAQFKDVPGHRPIATSTITGTGDEADGILQMLLWLRRSPESFVPDFKDAHGERFQLRELGTTQILRVNTKALHAALNAQRRARGMSWKDVDRELEIGSTNPLTSLAKGGRTAIGMLTVIAGWLGKPVGTFTRASNR